MEQRTIKIPTHWQQHESMLKFHKISHLLDEWRIFLVPKKSIETLKMRKNGKLTPTSAFFSSSLWLYFSSFGSRRIMAFIDPGTASKSETSVPKTSCTWLIRNICTIWTFSLICGGKTHLLPLPWNSQELQVWPAGCWELQD